MRIAVGYEIAVDDDLRRAIWWAADAREGIDPRDCQMATREEVIAAFREWSPDVQAGDWTDRWQASDEWETACIDWEESHGEARKW